MICHVAEPHEMPVDEAGNRADIVMDPNSKVNRMNLGGPYELYFNAAARDLRKEIVATLGLDRDPNQAEIDNQNRLFPILTNLDNSQDDRFNHVWKRIQGFYGIISPKFKEWWDRGLYQETRANHILSILMDRVRLYHPPDTDHETTHCVRLTEKYYKPTYGPVSYIGYSGKRVTTKVPVRIGSMYILLLEKTGDDWSAVSSGKLQNFGVLAQVTNQDKYSQATRNQAVRAFGETETRIISSCSGPIIAAEIIDRNNNNTTHRMVVDSVLKADHPSNILSAVDRTVNPLGNARPLQLVKHIMGCGGIKFAYGPHLSPQVPPDVYSQMGPAI